MTSIERTAYPRFKRLITAHELHLFFSPTRAEVEWAASATDCDEHLVALAGALFTAVVASARVYLGVHYLPDVAGGVLSAACAALLACGLVELPSVRRRLDVLKAAGGRARHAAPVSR